MDKWGLRRDDDGCFSFAAYVEARDTLRNSLMDRTADGDGGEEGLQGMPASPLSGVAKSSPLQAAHASEKLWKAKSAQLQYEEKIGAVCDRHGAVEAGQRTGESIRDLLRDRRRRLAEEVAGLSDPADIEIVLEREDMRLCAALEEQMKRLLNVLEAGNVAAA